jgi:hypothetical protein
VANVEKGGRSVPDVSLPPIQLSVVALLSYTNPNHSTTHYYLTAILILSIHPFAGFPNGIILSDISTNITYAFPFYPIVR